VCGGGERFGERAGFGERVGRFGERAGFGERVGRFGERERERKRNRLLLSLRF
jgi:hypothetical protein